MSAENKYLAMVREFTTASGYRYSDYTDADSIIKQIGKFSLKMITSEYIEMCVSSQPIGAVIDNIIGMVQAIPAYNVITDRTVTGGRDQLIASLTAVADHCIAYANKKKYNLDAAFKLVHEANMKKRFPDGTFHLRKEDGKVLKPPGFQDPVFLSEYYDVNTDDNADDNANNSENPIEAFSITLFELLAKVAESINFSATLNDLLQTDIDYNKSAKNLEIGAVAENELDAIIDIMYYIYNSISKLEQIA